MSHIGALIEAGTPLCPPLTHEEMLQYCNEVKTPFDEVKAPGLEPVRQNADLPEHMLEDGGEAAEDACAGDEADKENICAADPQSTEIAPKEEFMKEGR